MILVVTLAWILGCTAVFYLSLRRVPTILSELSWMWAPVVALAIRLLPAMLLQQGPAYEMHLFQETGTQLLRGENVLLRLPYLPFYVYWMAASELLRQFVGIDFTFWLKLPSIVADSLIAVLLYQYLGASGTLQRQSKQFLWLYVFNPVTILVSAYHGQFDTIAIFFLLLSLTMLKVSQTPPQKLAAALSLGMGILAKTWPGVLLLCILVRKGFRDRLKFVVGAAVIPLIAVTASLVAFEAPAFDFFRIGRRALQAGAIPGWWGYTGLANGLGWVLDIADVDFAYLMRFRLPIVLIPVTAMIWLTRKLPLPRGLLWSLITLFVVAPGFGLQSLSWLMPLFMISSDCRTLGIYVALSVVHMVISYWGIHFTPNFYAVFDVDVVNGVVQLSGVPVWILLSYLLGGFIVQSVGKRYAADFV